MPHPTRSLRGLAATALLLLVAAPSAAAQVLNGGAAPRGELTPFGGYQWGGSFDTDASSQIAAGKLEEQGAASWGAIFSYFVSSSSAFEVFYLRQDTNVQFDPRQGETRNVGDFANNYIQVGGRRDFAGAGALVPFVSLSLGVNGLDPKASDIDSSWRFAWTLGGGARYMMPNQRVGLRLDVRWMVTPVPSGDYGSWCTVWGCYATEGTEWLNQGNASAGLMVAF